RVFYPARARPGHTTGHAAAPGDARRYPDVCLSERLVRPSHLGIDPPLPPYPRRWSPLTGSAPGTGASTSSPGINVGLRSLSLWERALSQGKGPWGVFTFRLGGLVHQRRTRVSRARALPAWSAGRARAKAAAVPRWATRI